MNLKKLKSDISKFKSEKDMEKHYRNYLKNTHAYVFPKFETHIKAMPDVIFMADGKLYAVEFKFLKKGEKQIPKDGRYCRQLKVLKDMAFYHLHVSICTQHEYIYLHMPAAFYKVNMLFRQEWNRIYGNRSKSYEI